MKTNFVKYLIFVLLFGLSSCIGIEDYKNCLAIKIKVVDNFGTDITHTRVAGSPNVYVFDKNKRFLFMREVSNDQIVADQSITMQISGQDSIWIVAWGNIDGSEKITGLSVGTSIESVFVNLLKNPDGFSANPDELFFGLKKIDLSINETGAQTVVLRRVVSKMNISVTGLDPSYGSDYSFIIEGAKYDSYDFVGNLIFMDSKAKGNSGPVKYLVKSGRFNQEGTIFSIVEPFILFPSDGDGMTVSLYKGSELIGQATVDVNSKPITPEAGSTTNIMMNMSLNGKLTVYIVATDWNDVYQWPEW